jgi:hypothetical protein
MKIPRAIHSTKFTCPASPKARRGTRHKWQHRDPFRPQIQLPCLRLDHDLADEARPCQKARRPVCIHAATKRLWTGWPSISA